LRGIDVRIEFSQGGGKGGGRGGEGSTVSNKPESHARTGGQPHRLPAPVGVDNVLADQALDVLRAGSVVDLEESKRVLLCGPSRLDPAANHNGLTDEAADSRQQV
jgi:hypothetical protein